MADVVVIDPAQLEDRVRAVVQQTMLEHVPDAIRKANEPEYAGKDYVKERFGWTDRQLTYLRNKGRVEYAQHGRRILYHVPSIKEYIEEGTVQPRNGPLAIQDE
jgi:hypothetical protein